VAQIVQVADVVRCADAGRGEALSLERDIGD
jgi:hypothetical protein